MSSLPLQDNMRAMAERDSQLNHLEVPIHVNAVTSIANGTPCLTKVMTQMYAIHLKKTISTLLT